MEFGPFHDGEVALHAARVSRLSLPDAKSRTNRCHDPASRRLNASNRESGDIEGYRTVPAISSSLRKSLAPFRSKARCGVPAPPIAAIISPLPLTVISRTPGTSRPPPTPPGTKPARDVKIV